MKSKYFIYPALSLLLLFVTESAVNAQDSGSSAADKFVSFLKSSTAFEMNFSFLMKDAASGKSEGVDCNIKVMGSSYFMKNDNVEVYCDGSSRWILNEGSGEVTILKNSSSVADISENPIGYIASLRSNYNAAKKVNYSTVAGKKRVAVTLNLKSGVRSPYNKIVLTLLDGTGQPLSADFFTASGNSYKIADIEYIKRDSFSPSIFKPSQARLKGLYINDLR